MIEKVVLDHLSDALAVPVYTEKPEVKPESYVLIEKTGGGMIEKIPTAMIVLQSYAPSLLEAAVLNEEVKAAMSTLEALPEVGHCGLNSDYNFTDQETKEYRYQAVYDLVHY